jgi:SDR family mycofactocin-dependent oxidoreductase
MEKLTGRVAFITGAAHGQGRSHAVRLAEEGADIIAVDACTQFDHLAYPMGTLEELEETAALVEKTGRQCYFEMADVRDGSALHSAVEFGVSRLGPVRIVCANAAINIMRPIEEVTEEIWKLVIDINLTGVFNTIKAALPSMIASNQGGSIVITSSSTAISGLPFHAHYASSKAGQIGMMKSLSVELGQHNIRVNTLHPAAVNTAMASDSHLPELLADPHNQAMFEGSYQPLLPLAQAEPSDISDAVVFLASDESRLITGVSLPIDSGVATH